MMQKAPTRPPEPWIGRRVPRAPALTASLAFHLVLFVFGFAQAPGELISGGQASGGPVGPAFAVTLVTLKAPEASELQRAEQVNGLKLGLHPDPASAPLPASTDADPLTRLAQRLQTTSAAASGRRADRPVPRDQGAPSAADAELSNARGQLRDHASAEVGGGDAASSGDLWNAIAPCWRKLDYRGQEAVTIEVTLDDRGRLRGPPIVIRSPAALLTERRLKAEAAALSALTACVPRGPRRWAVNSHRIEFPSVP